MIAKLLWHPLFRFCAFWLIVGGVFFGAFASTANIETTVRALGTLFESLDGQNIASQASHAVSAASPVTSLAPSTKASGTSGSASPPRSPDAMDKLATAVENPELIQWLALGILYAGGALLVAYALMHTIAVRWSTWRARRIIDVGRDELAFAQNYETTIKPKLLRHPILGPAWKEFDDTLLKDKVAVGGPLENTIRPQAFINSAMLRERLPGLKVISSISGYFVGIGLLLTFIGIVLALHKASSAADSANVEEMKAAVTQLLHVASFKFWTSIAGLFTSIVFALLARWLVIWTESSLFKFCEAVEHQLRYSSPNSIAAEMLKVADDQRNELKEINSDRYFSKLADSVGPLIEQAMARAMSPVTDSIGNAIEQLKTTSQGGLAEMTKDFAAALHGGAGAEMRDLQGALREIQSSLQQTHGSLESGGESFARNLGEAAENLNRLVGEAGRQLEGSAGHTQAALTQLMASFKDMVDAANSRVDTELASAAWGASNKIESAMGRVLEQLESQVGHLMQGLTEFQSRASEGAEETQMRLRAAQDGLAQAVGSAARETADTLRAGLAEALARIAAEIDRFQAAVGRGEVALANQAASINDATGKTRSVADAFAETARTIRGAAAPLLETSDKMTRATTDLASSVSQSVTSLASANEAASDLSRSLTQHVERLQELWQDLSSQFDRIDKDLATAVDTLSDATVAQAEKLGSFVRETDEGLAKAVGTLASVVSDIRENTADLSDTIADLVKRGVRA